MAAGLISVSGMRDRPRLIDDRSVRKTDHLLAAHGRRAACFLDLARRA
jgi:hypothetical protein